MVKHVENEPEAGPGWQSVRHHGPEDDLSRKEDGLRKDLFCRTISICHEGGLSGQEIVENANGKGRFQDARKCRYHHRDTHDAAK